MLLFSPGLAQFTMPIKEIFRDLYGLVTTLINVLII